MVTNHLFWPRLGNLLNYLLVALFKLHALEVLCVAAELLPVFHEHCLWSCLQKALFWLWCHLVWYSCFVIWSGWSFEFFKRTIDECVRHMIQKWEVKKLSFETSTVLKRDKVAPNCLVSNWMQILDICGQVGTIGTVLVSEYLTQFIYINEQK